MDITGAKALKERLGHKSDEPHPARLGRRARGAPPVYHYLGSAWRRLSSGDS